MMEWGLEKEALLLLRNETGSSESGPRLEGVQRHTHTLIQIELVTRYGQLLWMC